MSKKKCWGGWKITRLIMIVLLLILLGHLVIGHWEVPEWWCNDGNWLTLFFLLLLFGSGLICLERANLKILESEKKKFLWFEVGPLTLKCKNIFLSVGTALMLMALALSLGFMPTFCDFAFVSAGQYFMILLGRICEYKELTGSNPPIGLSILSVIMWLVEGAIMGLIVTIVVNAIGIAKKE